MDQFYDQTLPLAELEPQALMLVEPERYNMKSHQKSNENSEDQEATKLPIVHFREQDKRKAIQESHKCISEIMMFVGADVPHDVLEFLGLIETAINRKNNILRQKPFVKRVQFEDEQKYEKLVKQNKRLVTKRDREQLWKKIVKRR